MGDCLPVYKEQVHMIRGTGSFFCQSDCHQSVIKYTPVYKEVICRYIFKVQIAIFDRYFLGFNLSSFKQVNFNMCYRQKQRTKETKQKQKKYQKATCKTTSGFTQSLKVSESKAWSIQSIKKISEYDENDLLTLKPDNTSATTGHDSCLARSITAHISASLTSLPITKIPLLTSFIISMTSSRVSELVQRERFWGFMYLVQGFLLLNQWSRPVKQWIDQVNRES